MMTRLLLLPALLFVAVVAAATPAPASATTPILWDLTHGVYLGYEPASRYSDLVSSLGAIGYTMETTSAGIDNVDLLSYAILVIVAGSCHDTPYTAAEAAAAQAYAASGGSILILGDNRGVWPENLNPLAQPLGTTIAIGVISEPDIVVDNLAAHPMFAGVTSIRLRAAGELGADTSTPVAWAPSGEVVATVGPADRVVVLGDMNLFENVYLPESDNAVFATSLFTWLHEPAPVENTTWGAVKALWSARR